MIKTLLQRLIQNVKNKIKLIVDQEAILNEFINILIMNTHQHKLNLRYQIQIQPMIKLFNRSTPLYLLIKRIQ